MCGIAGFIDNRPNYDSLAIANKIGEAIYRRGPDDMGIWQDHEMGVNLIHRRLSILDLSVAGHQPMVSGSGRYVMVFNGEVYNFKVIKYELEQKFGQINWTSSSDTEVILMAFETYGIESTLDKMTGMFAISLWDRLDKNLYLIRDRVGEKPLYYGYFNGVFGFASELKALNNHPKFSRELNDFAIVQYLQHDCIPSPLSIYTGISKLKPGYYLKLNYSQYISRVEPEPIFYWSIYDYCHPERIKIGEPQAIMQLDLLLKSTIMQQMVADVPVGCFLSGGVDSSVIAAVMQSIAKTPIKTFSIGFNNSQYNEAEFAAQIAQHLHTDHTELYVTEKDALSIIPELPNIYDEPFSDSSQIPTFLVSKLARTKVTVALSGDCGDEVFAGYDRHLLINSAMNKINKIPQVLRPGLKLSLALFRGLYTQILEQYISEPLNSKLKSRFSKFNSLLDDDFNTVYSQIMGRSNPIDKLQNSMWLKDTGYIRDSVLRMQYLDMLGYLPDDILTKVDRASMANSLEVRVPLLNHRIIEFAFGLPLNYKIRDNQSKWILRQVLYQYVPKQLIERPKAGFAIPLSFWLRGGLKNWADSLLSKAIFDKLNVLDYQVVKQKWQMHQSGKQDNGFEIWNILMFLNWYANVK